jgi:hypothetical protein
MNADLAPDRVFAVVDRVMSRPFEWGVCDCSTAACDVFADLHGIDPLAPWRGIYRGEIGAARLIRSMGGPLALAQEMAARAGLVAGAALGGVGLSRGSLVICIGPDLWAGKTKSGFAIVRTVEGAWHRA